MATTIPGTIERIKAALDAHFASNGFAWKTQESQDEHEQAKPTVYALTCAQRTADNWPTVCPSVTIELRGAAVSPEGRPAELRGAAIEAGRAGTRGHVPECYTNPALLQSDYKPSRALDLWEGLNYDTGR